MYTAMEHARDALAAIPGVVSCKIGIEKNISPADYPMIRIVPSRVTVGKPYSGRSIQALIYFGTPLDESEGLESVYAALSTLEASIISVLRTLQGRYIETVTDEDRLDTYKLMAILCELATPDTPHIKCAMSLGSGSVALTNVAAVVSPFTSTVQETQPADWTPTPAAGTIQRLLNGAAVTTTRVTAAGNVAGANGQSVTVGFYANGVLIGNRVVVNTTGATAVPFWVETVHQAAANVTLDVRASASANGSYTFSLLSFVAQAA
jgi:hypothetical protein